MLSHKNHNIQFAKSQVDTFTGEVLDDRCGKKSKPWRVKKIRALKLADSYKRIGQAKKAIRVRFCGSQLSFAVEVQSGKKRLSSADFCRERLCPMCAWRKSLKCFHEVSRVMDAVQSADSNLVPLFLTLTLRNCTGADLSNTLDIIFQGWNRLNSNDRMKRIIKGWFRALEVTYNFKVDTFHPHIHAILMVDKSYFTGKDYIDTRDWVKLWRKTLRLDYDPICYIRKVRGGNKALKEVSKYAVKDTDIFKDDIVITDKLVSILSGALKSRRLYAYGGILKVIAKQLGAERPEDGDLVHISEDENMRSDVQEMLVVYRWNMGLANYIAD